MSRSRDSPSRESFDKFDAKAPIYRPSELAKPLIFARESSISQKSKLSLSVTPFGEENSTRGPTVTFQGLTYRIKDRRSPLGFKTILSDVCGQFDWGKLAMILGASQSGKVTITYTLFNIFIKVIGILHHSYIITIEASNIRLLCDSLR